MRETEARNAIEVVYSYAAHDSAAQALTFQLRLKREAEIGLP